MYETAYSERKNDNNSISSTYFTIDDQNKISEHSLSTRTIFSSNVYTICCLRSFYEDYGHQNNYYPFAVLNKDGLTIDKISGNAWTINEFNFLAVRNGAKPIPSISFSLNSNIEEFLVLNFYEARSFQNIWNFFSELDQHCQTLREATNFHLYFERKIINKLQNQTLDDYKSTITKNENIITQYKKLLEKISEIVDQSNN